MEKTIIPILFLIIVMSACKSSHQPVSEEREITVADTIYTDTIEEEEVDLPIQKMPETDAVPPVLTPKQRRLKKLNEKLAFFRSLNSQPINSLKYPGSLIKKGDSATAVIPIKRKLKLLGLYTRDSLTIYFDSAMDVAVKRFQQMHNIATDGIPGKNTFRFLSWPVSRYIQKLEWNRDKILQQKDTLPGRRITINIPEYTLRFYDNDTLVRKFEVIVGKYKNQTPLLTSKVDYLVFNPCWTVPHSIAVKKILPRLKNDSLFLDKRNMFVTINGERKNHHEIDFSGYTKADFPYKIFQHASPRNALGQVKFMFDNPYSVYLHDTPSGYLFRRDFRTFSSGCIRVNDAMQLAKLILAADRNNANINTLLAKGFPVKVFLNEPIPIIIQYFTARYNAESDIVQFFYDCYGAD